MSDMHYYAILYYIWDQLISPEPSANFYFFLVFEFYRKGIPNGVQLTCQFLMIFYGPKEAPGAKELDQKSPKLTTRLEGACSDLVVDSWTTLM